MTLSMQVGGMCSGNAVLVVLGDVGHSPRMCYHAHSLGQMDVHVDLVGYAGSQPHAHILNHPNIRLVTIPPPPGCLSSPSVPRIAQLVLKLVWSLVLLLFTLLTRVPINLSLILLQNPPGIPSMLVCWLVARLKRSAFAVDWHNYTYTIIQQTFPKKTGSGCKHKLQNLFVRFAAWWEGFFGKLADISICVSKAMRKDLKERWGVTAVTLHDKPPLWNFVSMKLKDRHDFFLRLFKTRAFTGQYTEPAELAGYDEVTLFTAKKNDQVVELPDRPLLLMSSTSWTEDEDFGILLEALVGYCRQTELTMASANQSFLPRLFVVITGKGPQKQMYMDKIAALHLNNVDIVTAWLEPEDYPKLLACADLGVCLHTSSSGIDLPMKVVDMFGCGLPVLAKRFPAIDEQVQEGVNGRLFDTASQLRQHLIELASEFPKNDAIEKLRRSLARTGRTDWHAQWLAGLWALLQPHFARSIAAKARWERFRQLEEAETDEEEVSETHNPRDHQQKQKQDQQQEQEHDSHSPDDSLHFLEHRDDLSEDTDTDLTSEG